MKTITKILDKELMLALLHRFEEMVKQKHYNKVEYKLYKAFKMSLADHKGRLDLIFYDNRVNMWFDDLSTYTFTYEDNSLGTYLADCYLPEKRVERLTMPTKTGNDILNDLFATCTISAESATESISNCCASIKTYADNKTDYVYNPNSTLWFNTSINCDAYKVEGQITSLIDRIEKLEEKKESKTMKFNFDFGPVKDCVHMSMYGMAIKNKAGNYVSYDPATESIIDVDILNFEGANKFMFKMPVPISDIKVGDVVVHNGVPCFVKNVPDVQIKTFAVVDPYEGELKEILIPKSMFGFDYATKVVNLMEGMFGNITASAENPFGNMLPLMLMSDGVKADDMLPMMLMMSQNTGNTNMFSNPMMMYFMMKDNKNIDPMVMMLMMNQNQTHTCHCDCEK